MSISNDWFSSSTTAASFYYKPKEVNARIKPETEELKTIAKEEEEDKEKYLPIFDIKDLDI